MRSVNRLEKQFEVSLACGIYGAAYGAACAVISEFHNHSFSEAMALAPLGALVGAVSGLLASVVHSVAGRQLRWAISGALGGTAPVIVTWLLTSNVFVDPRSCIRWPNMFSATDLAAPFTIGFILGLALDLSLRSGKSILPGVHQVAAVVQPVRFDTWDEDVTKRDSSLTPSATPRGSGEETIPSD
jgi:hypothetical protein